jgi:hypothetical protein
MTHRGSEDVVSSLVREYFEHQELQRVAIRRDRTPTANRQYARVRTILDRLMAIEPEGRLAIEALMVHPMAYARLIGAMKVYAWDPHKAIPVLGRLLVEDLGAESSAHERGDIRLTARGMLYRHFGIDDFDRNRLIEPLRAYGIDLPRR